MSKTKRILFNSLSLIIGLFFASGFFWLNPAMILILGILMAVTLLINNKLNYVMYVAELFMFLIFLCSLSVKYDFNNAINISKSFGIIFQLLMFITSASVFGYNIYLIKKEW